MTNLLMSRDFNDFTNHELKVAENAIKNQRDTRDQIFMSQFQEGTPVAITTNITDEEGNYMVYPAYIMKVNKKSISVGWAVDSSYNPQRFTLNQKVWKLDQLKRHVQSGWFHNAMPSKWLGLEYAKQYEAYPTYIES